MRIRKYKILMSLLLVLTIISCSFSMMLPADAVEMYDYSGIFSFGNGKISADYGVYCCGFSGTTGYGGEVFPSSSSYTVSCNYRIFAACAADGRYFYFTEISKEFTDCNIVVFDSNTGLTDTFAVSNLYVTSNDMVAADSSGNIYFVPAESGSTVKCFAVSGRPCAEFSFGGSVQRLMTAGSGHVLAVCSNGNYLIDSSGGNTFLGGRSDVYSSGNGCFSDGSGNVYDKYMNLIYSGNGVSAQLLEGYVSFSSGQLTVKDQGGKEIKRADCVSGVSRVFAVGDTVITYNGGSGFSAYYGDDFYEIPEDTTEPPSTVVVTEEITRPTEAPVTEEPTEIVSSEEHTIHTQPLESYVLSNVYTMDEEKKYILNVRPSTREESFIGDFVLKNAEYILEKNNESLSYIANGDIVTFITANDQASYRIVVVRDFNCDGKFNGDDIEAIAYLLLDGGSIQQWQLLSTDADGDGSIGLSDLYQSFLES